MSPTLFAIDLEVRHVNKQNLVWSAGMAIAWKKLMALAGGPIVLAGADDNAASVVAALNASPVDGSVVDEACCVARAGFQTESANRYTNKLTTSVAIGERHGVAELAGDALSAARHGIQDLHDGIELPFRALLARLRQRRIAFGCHDRAILVAEPRVAQLTVVVRDHGFVVLAQHPQLDLAQVLARERVRVAVLLQPLRAHLDVALRDAREEHVQVLLLACP